MPDWANATREWLERVRPAAGRMNLETRMRYANLGGGTDGSSARAGNAVSDAVCSQNFCLGRKRAGADA